MKILIIGDFHGECDLPLKKIIQKEKINLILSPGDYCGNENAAKFFFKHYYGKDESEIPLKMKKLMEKLEDIGVKKGFKVIKKLKSLKTLFYGVMGNWDPVSYPMDIGSKPRKKDKKDSKKLEKLQTKDFRFIDFKYIEEKDFILIGGGSSTYPGKINKKSLKEFDKKERKLKIKEYNRRKKEYEKNFLKAKNKNKQVILLTHNCPYNTKLDIIQKGSEKGKHYGSFLDKEMIRRFKPNLVICGHMHENQGKDKIKKSLIINAGAAQEKKYAIIKLNEKSKKVTNIRFFKK